MTSENAGELPRESMLVDVDALLAAYTDRPTGPVAFGTSGHRGSSLQGTFNEAHILAISEAVCRHRERAGIDGPLFLARDTHALSAPAFETAVEVFLGHGIDVRCRRRINGRHLGHLDRLSLRRLRLRR